MYTFFIIIVSINALIGLYVLVCGVNDLYKDFFVKDSVYVGDVMWFLFLSIVVLLVSVIPILNYMALTKVCEVNIMKIKIKG